MKLDLDREKGLELFGKLIRTKNIESLQGNQPKTGPEPLHPADSKQKLQKCLTTLDLTSLGVGSCVGTGMYLVAGMVARSVAGPGVVISFIIAAIASIFSGACYAEFGVRVPHTTGSAYMYSYVTVGELIAFIIGWNMVLEYLIGTSACACALSACLDALANGAISEAIASSVGTILGRPPDFLAFVITILMMLLMAAGVKKSLVFNNVLNAINLAVWVFVMAAGMFYVDSNNWSEHNGFLPYGWSGVFTGAATCFYAFIGFDIIATTGEEATNPKKSIPLAIVSSLIIILVAYVTSSMVLTLIVPYDQVDQDSALVEMFGQVGAYKCKYIVAVGALAGLTVSMFGSMFPMPRIVYAMAQDGLIFRSLSHVWPATGTGTAIATLTSGICAAFAALLIQLEVLVEMMSIVLSDVYNRNKSRSKKIGIRKKKYFIRLRAPYFSSLKPEIKKANSKSSRCRVLHTLKSRTPPFHRKRETQVLVCNYLQYIFFITIIYFFFTPFDSSYYSVHKSITIQLSNKRTCNTKSERKGKEINAIRFTVVQLSSIKYSRNPLIDETIVVDRNDPSIILLPHHQIMIESSKRPHYPTLIATQPALESGQYRQCKSNPK
ncbi:hypothetical protein ACFW04_006526 [Cataglyphis niger]